MLLLSGASNRVGLKQQYVNLQALHKHEVHTAALCSPDAKLARRQSAAAAQLPLVFDALRALFGSSGPCVRPYDLVSASNPASHTFLLCICFYVDSHQLQLPLVFHGLRALLGFSGPCI